MTDNDESTSEIKGTSFDQEVHKYLDSVEDDRPPIGQADSSLYQYYPGAERDTFDYNNERFGIHKTTMAESIVHIVKGATGAGAGVMTMHEAFMYGGLWTSLVTSFCIGLINTYTMYMLAKSAHLMYVRLRISKLSYPDLAEVAVATGCLKCFRKFSKEFRFAVDVLMVFHIWGTCCAYQIMIANTIKQVLEVVSSRISFWFNDDIRLYITIITPILIILCIIRSLKFIAPFSILADMFIAVCILVTLYYSFQTKQNITDRPAWKNINSFFKFCGVCIYCTCGIAICLPIENNMRQPRHFVYVLNWGMGIEVMLISLTGFFGYWGWGEQCRSPINMHMPLNVFTGILQLLLAVMLSITFIVQFWVAFKIVWYNISKRTSQHFAVRFERIFRVLFTLLLTCMSILIPNLISLMSFIGLFILAFVNFIFPAFIEILITWSYDRAVKIRWRILKNLTLIIFGFLMCGCAVYSAVVS